MRIPIIAFLLGLVTAPAASAQSVAGDWDASMVTPGGVRSFRITFEVHGDSLSGTVQRPTGEVPLNGVIKGDSVEFTYVINYRGNDLPLTVRALVTGDTMEGMVVAGSTPMDRITARRAAAPPPPGTTGT